MSVPLYVKPCPDFSFEFFKILKFKFRRNAFDVKAKKYKEKRRRTRWSLINWLKLLIGYIYETIVDC